eukprot:COSAG01_NODE_6287_length_3752_cov_23.350123_3_plen_68_part_00
MYAPSWRFEHPCYIIVGDESLEGEEGGSAGVNHTVWGVQLDLEEVQRLSTDVSGALTSHLVAGAHWD